MIRIAFKAVLLMAGLNLFVQPLAAQKLSGNHYTLNIIGVDNTKSSPLIGSNRHTIFVGLGGKDNKVTTNIWLQPGLEFKVCDGNGFDYAYDCAGTAFKNQGATFQLPCNTYFSYSDTLGCPTEIAQRSYTVWARALGKPGGEANVMTCATDEVTSEVVCATENVLTLKRSTGKSLWQDATSELTSLVADLDGDGSLETVALFADGFTDFFWQWDNQGLRNAQIRFYPLIP